MSNQRPVRPETSGSRPGGHLPLILLLSGGLGLVFLLLALNRTDPAIQKAARPEDAYTAKMKLALTYMQQNGPPMPGIRLLIKLHQQYPQRFEASYQLGTMSMNTGQFAKAAGWFGK